VGGRESANNRTAMGRIEKTASYNGWKREDNRLKRERKNKFLAPPDVIPRAMEP